MILPIIPVFQENPEREKSMPGQAAISSGAEGNIRGGDTAKSGKGGKATGSGSFAGVCQRRAGSLSEAGTGFAAEEDRVGRLVEGFM